ncbi:MAG: TetR/AcrR family transcriptional regulator [Porticoccaceae bacterium]|nr:TetR/AcrR family transcriptional regulator [Porticoccaceae bacterium]
MKKPKAQSSKARDAIIDASSILFSENGYTGTTMRDIAEKVGVLPGSLYSHIKSKEEILLEIVSTGIERFLAIEADIRSMKASAEDKLRHAVISHVKVVAENPERMLIVFHQWRFLTEPNLSKAIELRRRYARAFSDILKEGIDDGIFSDQLDPKVEVFSILGALNWTPEWYSPDGQYSPEEIGNKMTDTMLYGIKGGKTG